MVTELIERTQIDTLGFHICHLERREGGREGGRGVREREGENFNHVMVNETFYLVNLSKQVVRLAKIFSLAKISSYTVCIMYTCMYMYACMCVHVHVHAHVPLAFHPDW